MCILKQFSFADFIPLLNKCIHCNFNSFLLLSFANRFLVSFVRSTNRSTFFLIFFCFFFSELFLCINFFHFSTHIHNQYTLATILSIRTIVLVKTKRKRLDATTAPFRQVNKSNNQSVHVFDSIFSSLLLHLVRPIAFTNAVL